jgi:hypothetical protein
MKIKLIKGDHALDWINTLQKELRQDLHTKIKDASHRNSYLFSLMPTGVRKNRVLLDCVAFNAFADMEENLIIMRYSFPRTAEGETQFLTQTIELMAKIKGGTTV